MYNEIYKALIDILDCDDPTEDLDLKKNHLYPEKNVQVVNTLSIILNIKPGDIARVSMLKIEHLPDIAIVVLDSSNKILSRAQYNNYLFINGKLTRIVIYNNMMRKDEEEFVRMLSIVLPTRDLLNTYVHYNHSLLSLNKNNFNVNTVIYYAPLLMCTKLLRCYSFYDLELYIQCFRSIYPSFADKINEDTILSTFDILKEISIENLLDNSYILAANPEAYPGLLFATASNDENEAEDNITEESSETDENEEDEEVSENE